jgi:hypothetical protein
MIERQIAISDGGKRIANGDDKSTKKEGGANERKRKLLPMPVKRMTWYTTDADRGAQSLKIVGEAEEGLSVDKRSKEDATANMRKSHITETMCG